MDSTFNEQDAANEIGNIGFTEPIQTPVIQESQFIIPNSMQHRIEEVQHKNLIEDIGWLNVPLENLPTKGDFYPDGTSIRIRAAQAAEIRHWSTIDENDFKSIDEGLNKVIDQCVKIVIPGLSSTYKDIKDIDRFYLVFTAREITFKKGENNINVNFTCNCGQKDSKTITKEMITNCSIPSSLEKYYDNVSKSYIFNLKNGESFNCYIPSIGISGFIFNLIREKTQKNENLDQAFLKWSPFLIKDHRIATENYFTKMSQDSFTFSLAKISVLDWFVTECQKNIDPKLKSICSKCSQEVTAPLDFPGGIKSIFLVSDITSQLL